MMETLSDESRKRPLTEEQRNGDEKRRYNHDTQTPLLKLLIPNNTAGALIGKGGSIISEIENKFSCSIRLSSTREFYPGTEERIVVIAGMKERLSECNNFIMDKVQTEIARGMSIPLNETRKQQVKIVLTNAAAGLLIGRGGLTIKAIQEESKAKISIADRDVASVIGERVLTMSGGIEERSIACQQIIEKISDEPSNMTNNNLRYSNTEAALTNVLSTGSLGLINTHRDSQFLPPIRGNGMVGRPKINLKTTVKVEIEVPEMLVGPILGVQGQTVSEFARFSGARIHFSPKDDFVEGTTNRTIAITGDMNATKTAYFLVTQKIEQVQSELGYH